MFIGELGASSGCCRNESADYKTFMNVVGEMARILPIVEKGII
jgi:hypothetical protein